MKKSTIIIAMLASFLLLAIIFSTINAYRNAHTVYNSIDPKTVEIKYYPAPQTIFITKNDEAGTELISNINGRSFGILKGMLKEEGWAFDHRPTPAENAHWRGMRIKK